MSGTGRARRLQESTKCVRIDSVGLTTGDLDDPVRARLAIGLDDGRRRQHHVPAVASEVDVSPGDLPRPLLDRTRPEEVRVHPTRGGRAHPRRCSQEAGGTRLFQRVEAAARGKYKWKSVE